VLEIDETLLRSLHVKGKVKGRRGKGERRKMAKMHIIFYFLSALVGQGGEKKEKGNPRFISFTTSSSSNMD